MGTIRNSLRILTLGLLVLLSLTSCGGGGGGGEFFGAAVVDLSANPDNMFVRDRTLITSNISEVNEAGIVFTLRYPKNLSYVLDTAKLKIGQTDVDVGPVINQLQDGWVYLVFVFSSDTFSADRRGTFTAQLLAETATDEAQIELQPTIRQAGVPDSQQFDLNNPKFGTDTSVTVTIKD
jgi:hypothetical protein